MSIYSNVLSSDDIVHINNLPEIIEFRNTFHVSTRNHMKRNIALPSDIVDKINHTFDINISTVPMTLIRGDTMSHIDHGGMAFNYTCLIYLDDSPGDK